MYVLHKFESSLNKLRSKNATQTVSSQSNPHFFELYATLVLGIVVKYEVVSQNIFSYCARTCVDIMPNEDMAFRT